MKSLFITLAIATAVVGTAPVQAYNCGSFMDDGYQTCVQQERRLDELERRQQQMERDARERQIRSGTYY